MRSGPACAGAASAAAWRPRSPAPRWHATAMGPVRTTRSMIPARAAAGEARAQAALDAARRPAGARAGAWWSNLLDPDVIVLGGGLSNMDHLYERAAAADAALCVQRCRRRPRCVRNMHGDSSGVRGAAWLWPADWDGIAVPRLLSDRASAIPREPRSARAVRQRRLVHHRAAAFAAPSRMSIAMRSTPAWKSATGRSWRRSR